MGSSRTEASDVTRAMAGDHDAFAALANANVDRMYALARVIVRDADRAEDATQEALVRAWRELPRQGVPLEPGSGWSGGGRRAGISSRPPERRRR